MVEFDRNRRWGHFVLTYGGASGLGIGGVTGSEDFDGNMEIRGVEQGFTFDGTWDWGSRLGGSERRLKPAAIWERPRANSFCIFSLGSYPRGL